MLLQSSTASDYSLQKEHIDIWEFSLENMPPLASSLLNEEEQIRAQRFYFPRHQRRFTIAHAMLRFILAHYLQQDAKKLTFTYNKYGKPKVNNSQSLEFNLSHSADLALIAVGKQFPLGIDIEFFSTRPYEDIAQHLFSPKEIQAFFKLAKELQPLIFFHIWAQKEAFIKACGMGLSYPTQQFDVPVMPPTHALIRDNLHAREWQVTSFMTKIGYSGALCYHPQIRKINYIRVDPMQFMMK